MTTLTLKRLGDFYEAFGDQAAIVAKTCGLVLTKRRTTGEPMCGFPVHSAADRIAELTAAGYEVEQTS